MYPKWVYDIFEKLRCTQCSAQIETEHINGVTTEFNPKSPFSKIPKIRINTRCPRCRTNHQVVQFKPLDTILQVINAHCMADSEQAAECESDEHPITSSGEETCDCATTCADQDPSAEHEEEDSPQPRDRKMLSPISDAEVNAFKRLLSRTSFKLSSKSFQKFMKRLESAK